MAGLLALVGLSVLSYARGITGSPFALIGDLWQWTWDGGPNQRKFGGFTFQYEVQEGEDLIICKIQLLAHQPEHPTESILEYRKERWRAGRQKSDPNFITWRMIKLRDTELPPIEAAVRTWPGPRDAQYIAKSSNSHLHVWFVGELWRSGWSGWFRDWETEIYIINAQDCLPPSEFNTLLNKINQALPVQYRKDYSLMLPKPQK